MKIVLATDLGGKELKDYIKEYIEKKGYEVLDLGTNTDPITEKSDLGLKAGEKVMAGEVTCGIVFCGSGVRMSMAINKVKGIRAALCHDTYTAKMAKMHNNANILVMGGKIIGKGLAEEMVDIYLETEYEGGRHQLRLDKIAKIEEGE